MPPDVRPAAAGPDPTVDLLSEQQAYYRLRAPEYDEWWQRRGRYDRGEEATLEWERQVEELTAALGQFGATGEVLELAGGTGWWTARLAETAARLTVVDGSPEAIDLNRRRVGTRTDVSYVVADLFEWRPERPYDVVFFSFWLSHVPTNRFAAFWRLVGSCLAPGGRVFFIDNRLDPSLTVDDPYTISHDRGVQRRRLSDGSEHRVVKLFYEPVELTDLLGQVGWHAEVDGTRWFIYGTARPEVSSTG